MKDAKCGMKLRKYVYRMIVLWRHFVLSSVRVVTVTGIMNSVVVVVIER